MIDVHSRIDYAAFEKIAPDARAALIALGKAVDDSGLDKNLTELVKLRVSQINGCAFCLQLHINTSRKLGVPPAKLDLIAVWREVNIFSARERAALAWAEALTRLPDQPELDREYDALKAEFSESEIAFLSSAIANINAWNRLGAGLRFTPPKAHVA